MKYEEGHIPKTLRNWLDKHAHQIQAVSHGSGYTTDSGSAYDILIEPGWCVSNAGDLMHTVIEATVADTLAILRTIQPCDCDGECAAARKGAK